MARVLPLIVLMTVFASGQLNPQRKGIPAIAREVSGAVVAIVMLDKEGQPVAQGSGFLVSRDGRVVTNYHVIRHGSSAVIKLPDGAFYVVDGVLAVDKARDIAVIKVHGENFRAVTLGDSDQLQVGEEVIAIGNPLSLESTVSNGIISGIRTMEESGGKFLQTTAPISPGSSGGPLFNMAGEVVGITTSGILGGGNLNFAIPINDAKPLLLARFPKAANLPDETEPVKAATINRKPDASAHGTAELSETLEWLSGASEKESGDGNTHTTFASEGGCNVAITETRALASPGFWIRVSFSLTDIDPTDIRVQNLGQGEFKELFEGQSAVRFHTTNYRKKIIHTSNNPLEPIPTADYTVFTNDWFAPRFAKAFKRAVELCGGQPSSF
jgi:hypothetical protein